jgi:hypothetical protein
MTAYGIPSVWSGLRCMACGHPAVRVVTRSAGHVHVCATHTTAAELAELEAGA